MSNDSARFHLSLKDGTFEISGSELFVSQQIETFKGLITSIVDAGEVPKRDTTINKSSDNLGTGVATETTVSAPANRFENLVEEIGGEIHVTTVVTGSTNAEKTLKCALIYAWAKNRLLKQEQIEAQEIRKVCEDQACYDPSNFSAHMKKKNYFIVEGEKNSNAKKYRLTKPGLKAAEELLEKIDEG